MRSTIHSRSAGKAAKLARRSSKHFGSQPDALGLATRLAAERLREAGIVLEPLLREAGLSVSQINKKDSHRGCEPDCSATIWMRTASGDQGVKRRPVAAL